MKNNLKFIIFNQWPSNQNQEVADRQPTKLLDRLHHNRWKGEFHLSYPMVPMCKTNNGPREAVSVGKYKSSFSEDGIMKTPVVSNSILTIRISKTVRDTGKCSFESEKIPNKYFRRSWKKKFLRNILILY